MPHDWLIRSFFIWIAHSYIWMCRCTSVPNEVDSICFGSGHLLECSCFCHFYISLSKKSCHVSSICNILSLFYGKRQRFPLLLTPFFTPLFIIYSKFMGETSITLSGIKRPRPLREIMSVCVRSRPLLPYMAIARRVDWQQAAATELLRDMAELTVWVGNANSYGSFARTKVDTLPNKWRGRNHKSGWKMLLFGELRWKGKEVVRK